MNGKLTWNTRYGRQVDSYRKRQQDIADYGSAPSNSSPIIFQQTNGAAGHWETEIKDSYYDTVVDKEAYDEEIIIGQRCVICGAVK